MSGPMKDTLIGRLSEMAEYASNQSPVLVWCELTTHPKSCVVVKAELGEKTMRMSIPLQEIAQGVANIGLLVIYDCVNRLEASAASVEPPQRSFGSPTKETTMANGSTAPDQAWGG